MAYATGSQSFLAYIKESTWGTTPTTTPTLYKIASTGNSLALNFNRIESGIIKQDRNHHFLGRGSKDISGNSDHEIVYRELDDFLESNLFGSWSTNVLKNGTTQKPISLEKGLTDISQYFMYSGLIANSMSLSAQVDAIVTASFGWLGKAEAVASSDWATVNSGTYGAIASVGTNPLTMEAGSIDENGTPLGIVTSISIDTDNGVNPLKVADSLTSIQMGSGRFSLTGTMSVFVTDVTLYNKFLNGTDTTIQFILEEVGSGLVTNNKYTFLLPKVQYTGGNMPVSGEGEIVLELPFRALYDTSEACALKITRADKTDV